MLQRTENTTDMQEKQINTHVLKSHEASTKKMKKKKLTTYIWSQGCMANNGN